MPEPHVARHRAEDIDVHRVGSHAIVEDTADTWREVTDLNLTSCAVATPL